MQQVFNPTLDWDKKKPAAARQIQQNDLCTQQILGSAWASAQSDQSLPSALNALKAQCFFMQTADAQADLSLRWEHRTFCCFFQAQTQIKLQCWCIYADAIYFVWECLFTVITSDSKMCLSIWEFGDHLQKFVLQLFMYNYHYVSKQKSTTILVNLKTISLHEIQCQFIQWHIIQTHFYLKWIHLNKLT